MRTSKSYHGINVKVLKKKKRVTLPETNIAHENPIFLGKYHQNGGFSMAMLVYRRVGWLSHPFEQFCFNLENCPPGLREQN